MALIFWECLEQDIPEKHLWRTCLGFGNLSRFGKEMAKAAILDTGTHFWPDRKIF